MVNFVKEIKNPQTKNAQKFGQNIQLCLEDTFKKVNFLIDLEI